MLRVGEGESSCFSDSDALKRPKVNPQQTPPSRGHQQFEQEVRVRGQEEQQCQPQVRGQTGSERLSHLPKDTDSAQHNQDEKPDLPPDL